MNTPNNLDWVDELLQNTVCASHLLEQDGCLYCDEVKLKQTVLSDLEKLIEENCIYGNEQENKAELLKEVRKYCE